jgi:Putative Flp pilus-assembly TadE/G-like
LLAAGAIIGIVALGMDGGRLMDERRRAQAAADAAALAAGADLYDNWWVHRGLDKPGTAKTAALNLATANGYANDGTSSIVTVNVPPTAGAFAGKSEYVEVIVESRLSRTFSSIFTGGNLVVKARAVACGRPQRIGLLTLRPNGADAFVNNALALAVLGNPVIVNSDDAAAYDQKAFGVVAASRFDVTGSYANPGGALIIGKIRTGVSPTPDPLRKLPAPSLAGPPIRSAAPKIINSLLPTVLQPGIYQGGIQINGLSIVVMSPGIYIMEGGGFQVSALATVTGLGTMIYNTSGAFPAGPITITGKTITTAPSSGTYQGIGIFQDRAVNQTITIKGTGASAMVGTIYAPAAHVDLTGLLAAGLDTLGGAYIVHTMTVGGVGSINIDLGNNPPRLPDVNLVE